MPVASAANFRTALPSSRVVSYCREARRLRCRFAGQPDRMQGALRILARREDRAFAASKCDPDRVRVAATVVRPAQVSGATVFSEQVEAAMDGNLLRYSMRMELLKAADRMGIGRFEANLIIAAVQHRRGGATHSSDGEATLKRSTTWSRWVPIATALGAVQAMIIAAALWAWHV